MSRLFIDCSYRSGLGTCFYDRVYEASELTRLTSMYRTVVVYGPRNVGKSELVKYWLRGLNKPVIIVDARLQRVESMFRETCIPMEYTSVFKDTVSSIVDSLASLGGLVDIVYSILRLFRHLFFREKGVVLFIDEYHLLGSYNRGYGEAVRDLEAIAGLLVKDNRFRMFNLVLSVSEGFLVVGSVRRRLLGYSTSYMLVEPLDKKHFIELYNEYGRLHGCSIDAYTVMELTGCQPGYLVELCRLSREELVKWITSRLHDLSETVYSLIDCLKLESYRETLSYIVKILEGRLSSSEKPLGYRIASYLVENNVLYPVFRETETLYKPVIPLYRKALEYSWENNIDTLLDKRITSYIIDSLNN